MRARRRPLPPPNQIDRLITDPIGEVMAAIRLVKMTFYVVFFPLIALWEGIHWIARVLFWIATGLLRAFHLISNRPGTVHAYPGPVPSSKRTSKSPSSGQTAVEKIRTNPVWTDAWDKLASWYFRFCESVLGPELWCFQCSRHFAPNDRRELHVDHITPVAAIIENGLDLKLTLDPHNLQLLCNSCNPAKGARIDPIERRPVQIQLALQNSAKMGHKIVARNVRQLGW